MAKWKLPDRIEEIDVIIAQLQGLKEDLEEEQKQVQQAARREQAKQVKQER